MKQESKVVCVIHHMVRTQGLVPSSNYKLYAEPDLKKHFELQ